MGLTIHYELGAGKASAQHARSLLDALRQKALALQFVRVENIVEFKGEVCRYEGGGTDDPDAWLKTQAIRWSIEPVGEGYRVSRADPSHIIAFSVRPGEGSEPANFGLCRYQQADSVKAEPKPTRPRQWLWRSFCKTQYASDPAAGGVANFLKCHVGLIRLLDGAKELGILREVKDEGKYWENRDVAALIQELGRWNTMIAGAYGSIRDALESMGFDPESLKSQIAKFKNFEQLEAKGREGQD